uniref:Subtilisin inhibitor 1 n=1 Tax=Anthurium amnicola TaxID=1678845 RepID=A0A1D1YWH3_9ARAE
MADKNKEAKQTRHDDLHESSCVITDVGKEAVERSSRTGGWPEVVGLAVEAAEERIKQDMPHAHFQVVPPGTFVTMDFNPHRVRLYLDAVNKVAGTPRVG